MSVVAIVPARGGSRGIPRKNLASVAARPLIEHTLVAALAAGSIDRTIVSTDDDEIAGIASGFPVEVVRRPAALARDESPTEDALIHVVEQLSESPEYIVTLEPTSPLRTAELIDRCVRVARERSAAAVMTVAEVRDTLGRLEGDHFVPLDPRAPRRRQLREPLYRESSTVYVTRTDSLVRTRSVLAEPLYAVVVSEEEAVDVNEPIDLLLADLLLRERVRHG